MSFSISILTKKLFQLVLVVKKALISFCVRLRCNMSQISIITELKIGGLSDDLCVCGTCASLKFLITWNLIFLLLII